MKLRVNGRALEVADGSTVLQATRLAGVDVPTTTLGIEVTYTSARFAKPERYRGEGRFIACIPLPPDDRYGLVCPVENDEWLITLCSRKDGWLGQPEQLFIALCRDYWREKTL